MGHVCSILPAVIVSLVALILALPWEFGSEHSALLAMTTFTFIHAFACRLPSSMPPALVFAVGLATDILSAGPLGFWALVYLVGLLVLRLIVDDGVAGIIRRSLAYLASVAAMALAGWCVASLYYLAPVDWRILGAGAAGSLAIYPVVAWLAGARVREHPRPTFDAAASGQR